MSTASWRRNIVVRGRSTAHRLRFDVVPYPRSHHLYGLVRLLNFWGVDVVLDVGANRGQYAEDLRRLGYADAIRSFEPVASAFEELSRRAAADPLWDVTNSALGREPGSAEINVAANGAASSSLLPMLDRHRAAAPEANYQSRESIRVEVLDDAAADLAGSRKSFLKVDTQGFEMAVLDGASGLLEEAIVAVQLELSLVPLYDGAPLYDEMLAYMSARGFRLCWVDPGFHDPDTHELLQFDGCFVKAAAAPPGA